MGSQGNRRKCNPRPPSSLATSTPGHLTSPRTDARTHSPALNLHGYHPSLSPCFCPRTETSTLREKAYQPRTAFSRRPNPRTRVTALTPNSRGGSPLLAAPCPPFSTPSSRGVDGLGTPILRHPHPRPCEHARPPRLTSARGARRPPRPPRPAHAGGCGGGRSARLPAGSRPQLQPRSPGARPATLCQFRPRRGGSDGGGGRGGGREGILGRGREGEGKRESPSLCGARAGGGS